MTNLLPDEETKFQSWYGGYAKQLGINPDPDDPLHYYDYRGAFKEGVIPDEQGHWPSKFKQPGHPRLVVDGIDTRTGEPDDISSQFLVSHKQRKDQEWQTKLREEAGEPQETRFMQGKDVRGGQKDTGETVPPGKSEIGLVSSHSPFANERDPRIASNKALEAVANGVPKEQVEAEWGQASGVSIPIYDPIDMVADLITGGMYGAGKSGLKALFKGELTAGSKSAGKGLLKEAAYSALAGSFMAGADEAGMGPVVQAISGMIGPTATAGLITMSRQGLIRFMEKLEVTNPKLKNELWGTIETVLKSERGAVGEPPKKAVLEPPESAVSLKEPGITSGIVPEDPTLSNEAYQKSRQFVREVDKPDLQIEGKSLDVNFDRLDTPDDVKRVFAETTALYREKIDQARRGIRSHEATEEAAQALGMTPEDLLKRREGQAFNAEESLAARNILVASASKLRELADLVKRGERDAIDPFLKQFTLHTEIQAQAAGVRAEAGRALNAFAIDATGEVQYLSKLGGVIEEIGTGITAERLARMIGSLETPAQLAAMARQMEKPGAGSMLIELWINALLSGPKTHMANLIGNISTAFLAIPERELASILHFGGNPGVVRGESTAMLYGAVNGFMDALRLAGKALKTGEPSSELTKMDTIKKAITADNLNLSGNIGRAVDILGEVVRIPGRFLMASDEFFKAINYRMELHAQAFRKATQENLTGEEFAKRVAEIIDSPGTRIKEAAQDFANYQTFTRELGEFGKSIQNFSNSHPMAKVVLPFTRTPANIMKYTLERTPILNLAMSEVRRNIASGGAARDLELSRMALGGMVMGTIGALASAGYITGGGPKDKNVRQMMISEGWQPYSIRVGDKYYSFNRMDPVGNILGMAADFVEISGELDEYGAGEVALVAVLSASKSLLSKTYLTGISNVLDAISDPNVSTKTLGKSFARSLVPGAVATVEQEVDPTIREANGFIDTIKSRIPGYSETLPPRRNLWGDPIRMQGGLGPDIISPIYMSTRKHDKASEELILNRVSISMPSKVIGGRRPPQGIVDPEERVIDGVELTPKEYDEYVRLAGNEYKVEGKFLAAKLMEFVVSNTGRLQDMGREEFREYMGGDHRAMVEKARVAVEQLRNKGPMGMHDFMTWLVESPVYQVLSPGPDGSQAAVMKSFVHRYREAAQGEMLDRHPNLEEAIKNKERMRAEARRPQL